MAENTDGTVALLAKAAGAPLGHPAAFQTLNLAPIAVLGQNRLAHIWTGKIVIKDFIYNNRNALINISSGNPFVIKGSGGGNGKIIAPVSVMAQ